MLQSLPVEAIATNVALHTADKRPAVAGARCFQESAVSNLGKTLPVLSNQRLLNTRTCSLNSLALAWSSSTAALIFLLCIVLNCID